MLLSEISVPVFSQFLGNLSGLLDKAAAHATAKKIDPAVLLGTRLAPDMYPFVKQVQLASDFSKGCTARLAGLDPPKFPDDENTIDELKLRLSNTIAFMHSIDRRAIDDAADRDVTFPAGPNQRTMKGRHYLLFSAMPNFYFHTTAAYAILRHCGVEIGMRDFIGPVPVELSGQQITPGNRQPVS